MTKYPAIVLTVQDILYYIAGVYPTPTFRRQR